MEFKEVKFSILIPTLFSRLERFALPMYRRLQKLADGIDDEVEILMLADNKKRQLAQIRQSLIDTAKGEYILFVDDDDEVLTRCR